MPSWPRSRRLVGRWTWRPIFDLLEFTRVNAMLADATDLSAESAATMMAQFAGLSDVPVEDYERLGSAIVHLGNNSKTTESKILDMAQGWVAGGTLAGLSADEILGVSAALSSVGVEADAGASSMERIFNKMAGADAKTRDAFGKVAGVSGPEFSKLFEDSPVEALTSFLGGLRDLDYSDALGVLEDVGLQEIRVKRAVLNLSRDLPRLEKALGDANLGWQEGIALSEEALRAWDTMSGKLRTLRDGLFDVGITVGETMMPALEGIVEHVKAGAEWFRNTSPAVKEFTGKVLLAGPALVALGVALQVGAKLIAPFYYGMMNLYTYPWGKVTAKMKTMSATARTFILGMGPVGWTLVALAGLALLIANWDKLTTSIDDATKAQEIYDRVQKATREHELEMAQSRLARLEKLKAAGFDIDEEVLERARLTVGGLEMGLDADTAATVETETEQAEQVVEDALQKFDQAVADSVAERERQDSEVRERARERSRQGMVGGHRGRFLRREHSRAALRERDAELEREAGTTLRELDDAVVEQLTRMREAREKLLAAGTAAEDLPELPELPEFLVEPGGAAAEDLPELPEQLPESVDEPTPVLLTPDQANLLAGALGSPGSVQSPPGVAGIPEEGGEPALGPPGATGEAGVDGIAATPPTFEIPALDQVPPVVGQDTSYTDARTTTFSPTIEVTVEGSDADPQEIADAITDRIRDEWEDATDDARLPAF